MFAACPSVFYQHGDLRWGEHPCTRGPEEGRVRKLKADRVEPDGSVICVDPESGEEFTLAVDDTLRAAVLPASATPTVPAVEVSPREIQARIRAGATVAELSTATGVAEDKIHRFAHPVLLERMRAAELARASHPSGIDGTSSSTLGELVAECLALRGSASADAEWDAWRPDDGRWVVQVGWPGTGDVEFAHWRFTPGSHGGVTEPLDDLAVELTEPELARAARRSVMAAVPAPAPRPQREVMPDGHEEVTVDADRLIERQSRADRAESAAPLELEFDDSVPHSVAGESLPKHRSSKRATPTVPAWEDVLLGVRSHPGE